MNLSRLALLVVSAALAFLVLAWRCDRGQLQSAVRAQEARALQAEGFLVASQNQLGELEELVPELQAEVERLRASSPGARVVQAIRATTGPRVATGDPRTAPPHVEPELAPCAPCLLAPGDRGEVRVSSATVETRAGNHVILGEASCWRLEPGPESKLLGGPFAASLSMAGTAEDGGRSPPAGLGIGVLAACGSQACGVGPALAAPSIRLPFGGRLDLSAGVTLLGAVQVGVSAIVR